MLHHNSINNRYPTPNILHNSVNKKLSPKAGVTKVDPEGFDPLNLTVAKHEFRKLHVVSGVRIVDETRSGCPKSLLSFDLLDNLTHRLGQIDNLPYFIGKYLVEDEDCAR